MPDNYTSLPPSKEELPPSNSAPIFVDVEDGRILPLPDPTQPVGEEVLATLSANEHTPAPRGPDQNGPIIPATNPAQPPNGHTANGHAPVAETASPTKPPAPLPPIEGADKPHTPGIATPNDIPDPFEYVDPLKGFLDVTAPENTRGASDEEPDEVPEHLGAPASDVRTPDSYRLSCVGFEDAPDGDNKIRVVKATETVREYHARITRQHTDLSRKTAALRRIPKSGPDGKENPAFAKAKRQQETVMPAMDAPPGTPVAGQSKSSTATGDYHNGVYGYDVDEETAQGATDWAALREEIQAMPSAILVGTSSGGEKLYAFIAGTPASSPEEYTARWYQLKGLLPSSVHVAAAAASHELNRQRFVCHDPQAWLSEAITPMDLDAMAGDVPAAPEETETGPGPRAAPGKPAKKVTKKEAQKAAQSAAGLEMDRARLPVALAFLADKKVGRDDNPWQAVGKCMKALGHSFEEFDKWSAQAGCTCDDRQKRWDSFDALDANYSAIIGMAVKKGWQDGQLHDWYDFGKWVGGALRKKHRFDSERTEWSRWTGTCWVVEGKPKEVPMSIAAYLSANRRVLDAGLAPVSATFADKEGKQVRILRLTEKNLNEHRGQGILRGLQAACDRPFPNYQKNQPARAVRSLQLAVPSGVVDLATGLMAKHDPLKHDTRSVTTGDYRPQDAKRLAKVLRDRFNPILDDANYANFLVYLGQTVSGEGQSFRALIMCKGVEGGGKGGLTGLLMASWGDRAASLPMGMLERSTQEIDSTRYFLMLLQPLFLIIDEGGAINVSTLNHIFGRNHLPGARLPFMLKLLTDTIPSVGWWTTIETPHLKLKTGVDRRMGFLSFDHKIEDSEKDAKASYEKDLLDAMVTIGTLQAVKWLKRQIEDPDVKLPDDVQADMDPIQEALSTLDPEEWVGKLVDEARMRIALITGDKTITSTSFGNAVNLHEWWGKHKERQANENHNRQVMRIKPGKKPGKDAETAQNADISGFFIAAPEPEDEPGFDETL